MIRPPTIFADDLGRKREIYEKLGVEEYYIFDPDGFHEGPPLKAFRAIAGELRPIDVEIANDCVRAFSPILGLDLQVDGDLVRLIDPETGEALPFMSEMSAALLSERERADAEKARAEAAEAEVARLREELERRRGAD